MKRILTSGSRRARATLFAAALAAVPAAAVAGDPLVPYRVSGGEIPEPLGGLKGDPVRGRELYLSRESNCALCHLLPDGDPRQMGDIGPPLGGVASRFSIGALRLRVVDSRRINPGTIMPAYYRVDGLNRVAAAYAGRPVLTAQEIEDVVAFLATLR